MNEAVLELNQNIFLFCCLVVVPFKILMVVRFNYVNKNHQLPSFYCSALLMSESTFVVWIGGRWWIGLPFWNLQVFIDISDVIFIKGCINGNLTL